MKFIILFIQSVLAWSDYTHFVISRIAYDILQEEDPQALQKVTDVLKLYSDDFTNKNEDKYPFVESVTLADDMKSLSAW